MLDKVFKVVYYKVTKGRWRMATKKAITIYPDDKLRAKLEKLAKLEDRPLSKFIVRLLEKATNNVA